MLWKICKTYQEKYGTEPGIVCKRFFLIYMRTPKANLRNCQKNLWLNFFKGMVNETGPVFFRKYICIDIWQGWKIHTHLFKDPGATRNFITESTYGMFSINSWSWSILDLFKNLFKVHWRNPKILWNYSVFAKFTCQETPRNMTIFPDFSAA